jgi:hypothetical protein
MKVLDKIVRVKSDFDYGRNNVLGYVATIVQFSIFIKVFHLPKIWYLIIIPPMFILTWLWGLILRKINFRKKESTIINAENPQIMDIHKSIKK